MGTRLIYTDIKATQFNRFTRDHTDEYNELLHANLADSRKLLYAIHCSQEDHEEYLYTIGGINKDEYI